MSTTSYASEQKVKTNLRPSRQAIKRAALALAAALGVAAAADFGHYYLTTGRYLETTDDAYVKADSTSLPRRFPATSPKCWFPTMSR